jgi:phosphoribosylanthranilate isomerase
MTFIKFCGMTREADVAKAIELSVDAVGFVLWPGSPRHVDLTRARTLINMLPPAVTPVGVFVRPSHDDIAAAIAAGIRVSQIHGSSENGFNDADGELWIAASLGSDGMTPPVGEGYTVLLDTGDPERFGGTGRTIDWTEAARVSATRRVLLAGGLTPGNVAVAVRRVRPYGVDVASGIETRPGVKDAAAMQAFVAAVREADR